MHEAQKANFEAEVKLANLNLELNDVSQENKILRKKLEEAWNQPDQSTPASSAPSPAPSQTPEPDLNKTIKVHDVTIQTISEKHRSGF